jgi:3-hydroxybutyryl-CoA dehydratase
MPDQDLIWSSYVEGMELKWPFSFSNHELQIFAKLSGDFNPIHTDIIFANSKGFAAPLIYGLLLSSQMSRLIGQELSDPHAILVGIQMDFLSPGFADDNLEFAAKLVMKSDATHALEFKCVITRANKILCRGRVSALWRP